VVDRALRLGIELPAVGTDLEGWRDAAVAVEAGRAGAIWIAAGEDDPCTLAGSLVPFTTSVLLGAVTGCAPSDRHPSILARDVTALDVLSGGRAVVQLTGDDVGRLAEAAQVCRLLFTEDSPSYRGRHFGLESAANRPPPVRAGGPPIVVAPDEGVGADEAGRALSGVDAVVVGGGTAEVSAWREALAGPALLRRGPLRGEREVAALLDAGADGLIVQFSDPSPPSTGTLSALVAAVDRPR
jgi:alkanesulfonate monooxygenase SsuD/methylene tetrahydromethanopterin reductase-like flavin-dependent oxidoreductase (luciferase family)